MSLASDRSPPPPSFSDADALSLESTGERYEFVETLSYGVLADVYLALRKSPHGADSLVVLKRLRKSLSDDRATAEMFLTEGRISMKLRHPNVVQGIAIGDDAGRPFLVMEFIEGETLQALLDGLHAKGTRLPPAIAAYVAAEIARGLHYAHELRDVDGTHLGIVHRDVSPHNVVLGFDGTVKILDFGIAKTALPREATAHGVMKGKLAYMAPEQVLGQKVDGRADVFALGIVLWEMVTGERLMLGASMFDTMDRIMKATLPRASSVVPQVPAALDEIIRKALTRDREGRFASADELRIALRSFLRTDAPTVGSDELSRVLETLFAERRTTLRTQRQSAIVQRRAATPSGLAPARSTRTTPTPSSSEQASSSVVRRLEQPTVTNEGRDSDPDPWSQTTARYALVDDDGTNVSQRTTLPANISRELLAESSREPAVPSRRTVTDVRGDMRRSNLSLTTPRESLHRGQSLLDGPVLRAPTIFPDDEGDMYPPRRDAHDDARESSQLRPSYELPDARESSDMPRARLPMLSYDDPRETEIFVRPPMATAPHRVAAKDLVAQVEARRWSIATIATAALLVLCLIAILAHPKVRGGIGRLLSSGPDVAGARP